MHHDVGVEERGWGSDTHRKLSVRLEKNRYYILNILKYF